MAVVPLFVCSCGATARRREVFFRARRVGEAFACDSCQGQIDATLDRVRPIFDKMLECDVPREVANDIMGVLLNEIG